MRLIQIDSLPFVQEVLEYDAVGNIRRSAAQNQNSSFAYDALDRLIRIETPRLRQDFTYDALHRCLSKTISQNGTPETQYFLYDGQNEIGSFDESLRCRDLRILGEASHAEIGAAIAIELQGKAYAPIHDLQGNVAALVPLDHSAATIYRYSAFGEEKIEGEVLSPWRFSSKRIDAGTGLVVVAGDRLGGRF